MTWVRVLDPNGVASMIALARLQRSAQPFTHFDLCWPPARRETGGIWKPLTVQTGSGGDFHESRVVATAPQFSRPPRNFDALYIDQMSAPTKSKISGKIHEVFSIGTGFSKRKNLGEDGN
jgi:hypothetical protein